jgi:cytochrome c5
MRDRWLSGMVAALSALALVGSVLFALTRGPDTGQAQATEPDGVSDAVPEGDAPMDEASPGAAPAAEEAADAPSGPAVFKARCKRCHSLEETVELIKKQPADKREPWLTRLLARHFPPPPEERPALVKYLLEETARSER